MSHCSTFVLSSGLQRGVVVRGLPLATQMSVRLPLFLTYLIFEIAFKIKIHLQSAMLNLLSLVFLRSRVFKRSRFCVIS